MECSLWGHKRARHVLATITETGKKEVKLSLFKDDTLLYVENPKKFFLTVRIINDYSKIQNQHTKSMAFLYITMKNMKMKLRKQVHL